MRVHTGRPVRSFLIVPLALGLALGAPGCGERADPQAEAPRQAPVASAEEEQSLIDAHLALIAAFQNLDADAFVALLEPTQPLLIFHPLLENRFDGRDEAREGVARMFSRMDDVSWTDVHPTVMIRGELAWVTSQILVTSSHMSDPFVGRGTEIWIRGDDGWKLIHGHWSEHAKLAG